MNLHLRRQVRHVPETQAYPQPRTMSCTSFLAAHKRLDIVEPPPRQGVSMMEEDMVGRDEKTQANPSLHVPGISTWYRLFNAPHLSPVMVLYGVAVSEECITFKEHKALNRK